jgi:hypothetical protein
MTYTIVKNKVLISTDISDVFFEWKQLAKTVGWTVLSSGDGMSLYNPDGYGDCLTTALAGAGGFSNNKAWFRIRMPTVDGYNREFLFHRSSTSKTYLNIYYSFSSKFIVGGSAIERPTANDEVVINSDLWSPNSSPLNYFICCGDGYEMYKTYICGVSLTYPNPGKMLWAIDRVDSQSYILGDADPYMFWRATGPNDFTVNSIFNPGNFRVNYWMGKGNDGGGFVDGNIFGPSGSNYSVAAGGSEFFNYGLNYTGGAVDVFSCIIGKGVDSSMPRGVKGTSSLFQCHAADLIGGDTLSTGTTKDRIVFNDLVLPWDNSEPIV